MLDSLNAILDPEVQPSRVAFINQTQQCFAVKSGVNNLLDVARSTFCRLSEDIHNLAEKYRSQYQLQALKVCGPDASSCFMLLFSFAGLKLRLWRLRTCRCSTQLVVASIYPC